VLNDVLMFSQLRCARCIDGLHLLITLITFDAVYAVIELPKEPLC
jgi:hypothetical protein